VAILLEDLRHIQDPVVGFLRSLVGRLTDRGVEISVIAPSGHVGDVLDLVELSGAIAVYGRERVDGGEKRVLLLDHQPRTLDYLRALVRATGHRVLSGRSVLEILSRADAGRLDLAFLDLAVPEGGAIALSQKLLQVNPGIDIVALSSFSDMWDEPMCRRLGIWRRLEKPYRIGEFLRAILEGGKRSPKE